MQSFAQQIPSYSNRVRNNIITPVTHETTHCQHNRCTHIESAHTERTDSGELPQAICNHVHVRSKHQITYAPDCYVCVRLRAYFFMRFYDTRSLASQFDKHVTRNAPHCKYTLASP